MSGGNGGFEVSADELSTLSQVWHAHSSLMSSMADQLANMVGEVATAASQAANGKSASETNTLRTLAQAAEQALTSAASAVSSLSGQLSEGGENLAQTQQTYQLAELATKDRVSSISQLQSYSGADASQIHSLAGGLHLPASGSGAQAPLIVASAAAAATVGAGGTSGTSALAGNGTGGTPESTGASPDGSGGGSGGAGTSGGYSGGGGAGGGYAGSGGGSDGGSGYTGTGTPVAPGEAASSEQVKKWIQEAIKELEKEGVPASKLDPNAIALIIQHESGGNPNAVNNWDINAKEGNSSEGLMQTTPTTFQEYASPGHTNILSPIDNIMSASKYAIARYGSLDNVPGVVAVEQGGSYVGY